MRHWILLDPLAPKLEPLGRLPWQKRFAHSTAFNTLVAAGKGSGKSIGLLHYQEKALWDFPGKAHIFTAPTDNLTRYFVKRYFEPAFRNMIIRKNRGDQVIDLAGGRQFVYRTSGNLDALEMYTCATGSVDEMQISKPSLVGKINARLRGAGMDTLGRAGFVCTPDSQWLKREFEGRDDADKLCIHASLYDNPLVSPEWIKRFGRSVSEDLFDAWVMGRFITPGNTVYSSDVKSRNILDSIPASPMHMAWVDFGFRFPHVLFACLLPGYADGRDAWLIYDEIVGYNMTSHQLGDAILDVGKKHGIRISGAVADPAGKQTQGTGESDVAILQSVLQCAFYFPHPKLRAIRTGVVLTKTAFNPREGAPRLYIYRGLIDNATDDRAFYECIDNYSWPKDKEGKAIVDEPLKDGFYDHAMDAMRYGVVRMIDFDLGGTNEAKKGGGL